MTEWNYIHQPDKQRHMGCMAQDFYEAFHLNGESDTTINTFDIDGVNMAGIQALKIRTDELKKRTDELQAAIAGNENLQGNINEMKNAISEFRLQNEAQQLAIEKLKSQNERLMQLIEKLQTK